MTTKSKRRLTTFFCATAAVAGFCTYYVRTHPLVFNESFLEHAHCMKGGGLSLMSYAYDHGGRFPFHTNGYGDALLLVNDGWDAALTGPGYDTKVFERARRTGEHAPESEFGQSVRPGVEHHERPGNRDTVRQASNSRR